MKFLFTILPGAYLGGVLSIVGITFLDWRFYAILIPTTILFAIREVINNR